MPAAALKTNGAGLTANDWLNRANRECARLSGLLLGDLGDGTALYSWTIGEAPEDYARRALIDYGFALDISEDDTIID